MATLECVIWIIGFLLIVVLLGIVCMIIHVGYTIHNAIIDVTNAIDKLRKVIRDKK